MLKSLIFASFVALVIGDELTGKLNAKLKGDWTPVKIFPPVKMKNNAVCNHTNITVTENWCECDGKQTPQMIRANKDLTNELPIIIVENEQELQQAFNATCLCKEMDETKENFGEFRPSPVHLIIKILNDNYFIAYDKGYRYRVSSNSSAILLAKQVPTAAELVEFILKSEDLKNMRGTVVCTKNWADPYWMAMQVLLTRFGLDF